MTAGQKNNAGSARTAATTSWERRLFWCVFFLWNAALLIPAAALRDPFFTRIRPELFCALSLYSFTQFFAIVFVFVCNARRPVTFRDADGVNIRRIVVLILAVLIFALARESETRHANIRARVLNTPGPVLAQVGSHFIVGYQDPQFVYDLIAHDALGGVFITHHNVRGKSTTQIAAEIAEFQTRRAARKQPPLWIATDQEGGGVSRLSPPLTRQPFLSTLLPSELKPTDLAEARARADLARTIRQYAQTQGRALSDLGVNVNFAPVADLRFEAAEKTNPAMRWMDAFSRIESRAIHRDPAVVAFVAGEYARGLGGERVYATLKHFPGLGRVAADTHWFSAAVPVAPNTLQRSDWIPFRAVTELQNVAPKFERIADTALIPWIMLGHAQVPAIDPEFAASHSKKIVTEILRRQWKYDGVLITDDYNMRPIMLSPGGMGGAAVRALNGGVDLILISYDGENVYPVLEAVLNARANGTLNQIALARSEDRLRKAMKDLQTQNVPAREIADGGM